MWRKKNVSCSDGKVSRHPFLRKKSTKKSASPASLAQTIARELIESSRGLN
ncbi:hypothetical protein M8998_02790 [Sphingobacterium sp. lm-10]|uniref:hypothetical protein n=1 Tax=Sphingobacterium sp. lm-10 TaxID=2944904 RepID=UPI00201FD1BC|nr:hypothetical protein [Sphingobacterium sp. lm-10]MCL7986862.1 hypothetical protein [Sphingobacterium sp. lm-10]